MSTTLVEHIPSSDCDDIVKLLSLHASLARIHLSNSHDRRYHKQQIASSDYEGIVSLWDAYTGKRTVKFEGHKKRTWSVDFAPTSPSMVASGSDDHQVKIWDVRVCYPACTTAGWMCVAQQQCLVLPPVFVVVVDVLLRLRSPN